MPKIKNVLPTLFLMVLLDQVAFGILLPIMSLLFVESHSAYFLLNNSEQVHTIGYLLLGLLFATFPFAQFIAAPVLGEFSDKFGRKPILVFAVVCITAAYALFAGGIILRNIPLLFLARMLSGIGGGSVGAIFASAADISTASARTKNFGIIASASGLGLILGPLIGGILSDSSIVPFFNLLTPLYALAFLGVLNLLIVTIWFPETHKTPDHMRRITWLRSLLHIRESYRNKNLRGIFLVSFLFSVCLSLFLTFGSVVVLQRFSLSQTSLSYFLGYFGFWIIVTQLGLIRLLLHIAREEIILRDSLLGIAVGLLMLYFVPSLPWLLLITPVLSLSVSLSYTMITSLLSDRSPAEKQGEMLGINTSVQSLAQTIPALFSGFVAASLSVSAPIIFGVIFAAGAGIYVFTSKKFYSSH